MPAFVVPQSPPRRHLAVALLIALLATACGTAVGNPGVAAVVNDSEIPVSAVAGPFLTITEEPLYDQQVQALGQAEADRRAQARVLTQLVLFELLADEAVQQGLDLPADEEVQAQQDALRQQFGGEEQLAEALASQLQEYIATADLSVPVSLLQQSLVEGVGDAPATEEEIQQFYSEQVAIYNRVRHILVGTEEEAQAALDRIEAGEDFADVATEVSTDPGSGPRGGDLGPLVPGNFVPAFEEAALAADPGDVVGPVQTDFGWHVIGVLEPELTDDLREQIEQIVPQRRLETYLQELVLNGDIVINPRFGRWNGATRSVEYVDPLGRLEPADPVPGGADLLAPGAGPTESQ